MFLRQMQIQQMSAGQTFFALTAQISMQCVIVFFIGEHGVEFGVAGWDVAPNLGYSFDRKREEIEIEIHLN